MTWFKVDDSFYRSRKVRKLGRDRVPAVGLWTLCGDWSADNLTDGFVPWEIVEDWDEDREWSKRLVAVGLWAEVVVDGEDGVSFHDWGDWQPTSDQVKQRRKADADRRARWRETQRARGDRGQSDPNASQCDADRDSRSDATVHNLRDATGDGAEQDLFGGSLDESRRDAAVSSRDDSRQESALPDPARPDPARPSLGSDPKKRRKEPARPLPETWKPNGNHTAQASELGLDLDQEVRQFRNHAEMNDRRMARWDACFRQWLELAHSRYGRGNQPQRSTNAASVSDLKKHFPRGGVA